MHKSCGQLALRAHLGRSPKTRPPRVHRKTYQPALAVDMVPDLVPTSYGIRDESGVHCWRSHAETLANRSDGFQRAIGATPPMLDTSMQHFMNHPLPHVQHTLVYTSPGRGEPQSAPQRWANRTGHGRLHRCPVFSSPMRTLRRVNTVACKPSAHVPAAMVRFAATAVY